MPARRNQPRRGFTMFFFSAVLVTAFVRSANLFAAERAKEILVDWGDLQAHRALLRGLPDAQERSANRGEGRSRLSAAGGLLDHELLLADHLGPAWNFRLDVLAELLRRACHRLEHLRRHETLLKRGIGEDFLHFGVDLHHNIARRAAGRRKAKPG